MYEEEQIINIARKNNMPRHLMIYLLAVYRSGLNIKAVVEFEDMIELAIESLVKNEQRFQDYIIKEGGTLSWEEFLAYKAGPYGTGWTAEVGWLDKLKENVKQVKEDVENGFKKTG